MNPHPSNLAKRAAGALLLPITVTILIPALILIGTSSANPGLGLPAPVHLLPAAAGIALIAGGLVLIANTVSMFRSIGQGTLAPWDPTQRLVVIGVYRYVRNPMISGVIAVTLGEAVLFGSLPLLVWALIVIGVNLVYIPLSEEPGLRERFGADYETYTRHVPRWLPRRTPWSPTDMP